MKRHTTIILLMFLSTAGGNYCFSQPGCYDKYFQRGERSRNSGNWAEAVKHYEAALKCDTLSAERRENIQQKIELSYASWGAQLEILKTKIDATRASVRYAATNVAKENLEKGDYNKAFSFLHMDDMKQSPELAEYRNDLLPYLSDTILFNAVQVKLFSHKNSGLAVILERKSPPKKQRSRVGALEFSNGDSREDRELDTVKTTYLRLSFYDISGPSLKKIGKSIDSIEVDDSRDNDDYYFRYYAFLEKNDNEINLVTDFKIYLFNLENFPSITKKEISYNQRPRIVIKKSTPRYHKYDQKWFACDMLSSNKLVYFSNHSYDSLRTRMMFTMTLTDRHTGNSIIIDSVYNFSYHPAIGKLAIQKFKYHNTYEALIVNYNTGSQTSVLDNVSGIGFGGNILTLYQQPGDSSSNQQRPASPTTSMLRKNNNVYYDLTLGKKLKYSSNEYSDSLKLSVTRTEHGYIAGPAGRLVVYDSLFRPQRIFKSTQYSYVRSRNKLFLFNKKPNARFPTSVVQNQDTLKQDTLKIIDPELKDSLLLYAETIYEFAYDSIIVLSNKSETVLLSYAGNGPIVPLSFPGRKIVQVRRVFYDYYILYAKKENDASDDTLTLVYSLEKRAIQLELPGKMEWSLEHDNSFQHTRLCLYNPNPGSSRQTFAFFDTASLKLVSFAVNVPSEKIDKLLFANHYADRNILLLGFSTGMVIDEDSDAIGPKDDAFSMLKSPKVKLYIYDLNTGAMETIFTTVNLKYTTTRQILGNFLLIGNDDLYVYDELDNVRNYYFYNLHLFGDARKNHYTRKYGKADIADLPMQITKAPSQ